MATYIYIILNSLLDLWFISIRFDRNSRNQRCSLRWKKIIPFFYGISLNALDLKIESKLCNYGLSRRIWTGGLRDRVENEERIRVWRNADAQHSVTGTKYLNVFRLTVVKRNLQDRRARVRGVPYDWHHRQRFFEKEKVSM